MIVRAESTADAACIAAVVAAAFGRIEEAELVARVRDSAGFSPELSLVAVVDEQIVGHVLLSPVELHGAEVFSVLELAPLAVHPEHQGRGIGTALGEAALLKADQAGEPLVLVLGSPRYYPRFGFLPCVDFGIAPPDPALGPSFMVRPLSRYERRLRGQVVWPPAFSVSGAL